MMKTNKTLLLFLILLSQLLFSQQVPRELLSGKIMNDSIGLENIKVLNLNINKFAISDQQGYFNLYARPKDTLVFSSFSSVSKKIILTEADFNVQIFKVKLESFSTTLDEIIISPNALTGNLNTDQKNIKIKRVAKPNIQLALITNFEDDTRSSPTNKLMPGYIDRRYMMDFMAIGTKIVKLIQPKKKAKKIIFTSHKYFPDAIKERYSSYFFENTLHLTTAETGLFLAFCEADSKANELLEVNREIELIAFLIAKRKEFVLAKKE